MTRVALATCTAFPDLEADERRILAPLAALGVDAVPAIWDDPAADWSAFDLVVVRCTWDYSDRRAAFLRWAGAVPRLANPAAVLAWNTDKRYLGALAEHGLAIVPTRFLAPGEPLGPVAGEIVVKPTVGAGARGAGRFGPDRSAAAAEHLAALHAAGATAMVQPYVAAVDTAGETALVYLGGAYSHAIGKAALLRPGAAPSESPYLEEDISVRVPSAAERALADRAVAAVAARFGPPLYARVDLLPGPDGEPLIIELELTEPSLFLGHDDAAPARLAAAIAAATGPAPAP